MASRTKKHPRPTGLMGIRPIVAIVGRPNVGKSTLFNRLAGQRIAIVEDLPGVTRDRHYADTRLLGRDCVLVDTGGFDPESDDPMQEGISNHVRAALEEADVVLCVLDATASATPADREAVRLLRKAKKPVVYVANKADSKTRAHESMELYELGMKELLPISAEHALGLGEMEEKLVQLLPPRQRGTELDVPENTPRVAIVGRPNAGKSSLTNQLFGKDQQLVDDRPGTTMDSIDTLVTVSDNTYVLIDTAGIRRKRAVRKDTGAESLGVLKAIRAIERSDAVILMVDGFDGVAEQDARLAGLAVDRGRALVVGLNKTDLMDHDMRKKAIERTKEILSFAPWAEIVALSAKTGRATKRLMETVDRAIDAHRKRATTAEVNRFFEEVIEHHPPPIHKGKAVRLYYVTQASTRPPTFVAMANFPDAVHFSYERYVINQLRERFALWGTPVRVFYRKKKQRADREIPGKPSTR